MEQSAELTDVIEGFGNEWTRFDQTGLTEEERLAAFEGYFEVFPWDDLPKDAGGVRPGLRLGSLGDARRSAGRHPPLRRSQRCDRCRAKESRE